MLGQRSTLKLFVSAVQCWYPYQGKCLFCPCTFPYSVQAFRTYSKQSTMWKIFSVFLYDFIWFPITPATSVASLKFSSGAFSYSKSWVLMESQHAAQFDATFDNSANLLSLVGILQLLIHVPRVFQCFFQAVCFSCYGVSYQSHDHGLCVRGIPPWQDGKVAGMIDWCVKEVILLEVPSEYLNTGENLAIYILKVYLSTTQWGMI